MTLARDLTLANQANQTCKGTNTCLQQYPSPPYMFPVSHIHTSSSWQLTARPLQCLSGTSRHKLYTAMGGYISQLGWDSFCSGVFLSLARAHAIFQALPSGHLHCWQHLDCNPPIENHRPITYIHHLSQVCKPRK